MADGDDGMTDDEAAEAYMAALAELERNPWQERAEAAEARYADALGEIKNAVELAEAGNVTGCLFMLSTYLEGVRSAEEQVEAKGQQHD